MADMFRDSSKVSIGRDRDEAHDPTLRRTTLKMDATSDTKRMRLRYAGRCRECGAALAPGTTAIYDKVAKDVMCLGCVSDLTQAPVAEAQSGGAGLAPAQVSDASHATEAVEVGVAGASARREFERRVAKREQRIRARHPKIGGLILALSEDPQSTTAWQRGAKGEELLGKRLDGLSDKGVRLLHDRRIRGTRANVDHIAISSAGVFVLDAKRYKGRPNLKIEGGFLRPRTETLIVGGRKCNPLVEAMHKQVRLVGEALTAAGLDAPVIGMLVFIEADWPLFGGDFTTQGVKVLWPKKATEHILTPGALTDDDVSALHRALAESFPPAA